MNEAASGMNEPTIRSRSVAKRESSFCGIKGSDRPLFTVPIARSLAYATVSPFLESASAGAC